jgi:hypothetical protein
MMPEMEIFSYGFFMDMCVLIYAVIVRYDIVCRHVVILYGDYYELTPSSGTENGYGMFKKFSSCYKIMRFVTIIELYSE